MVMHAMSYQDARPQMRPGDVIAFGGKGHFSELIKFATCATVSHVGTILQTRVRASREDRFFNQIIESTSLNGFNGVNVSRFSDRLSTYEGDVWWLPLSDDLRRDRFNQPAFYEFLFNQAKDRKPYDMPQAVKSALDKLDEIIEFTQQHFRLEERLMVESAYEQFEQHKLTHEALLREIVTRRERLAGGEDVRRETMDFLERWLVDHILDSDKHLGDHLKDKLTAGQG